MEKSNSGAAACPLALVLFLSGCQAGFTQAARQLQPYVAENKLYALHKPAGWTVREEKGNESFRIIVSSPDKASTVDFFWARNTRGKSDSLGFLASYWQMLDQAYAETTFGEVFVSPDSSRALATVSYRSGKALVKGRYYFESKPGGHSAQGYMAPQNLLASQRPLLLNVMASLAFSRARLAASPAGQPMPAQEPFVQAELVRRQAPDGSLSISIPADWQFLAGGGKVVAGAPDGGTGVIFTSLSGNPLVPGANIAQGIIGTTYLPPAQALVHILKAFRHQNVRLQSAAPDPATLQECRAYGRTCDAQDIVVQYTSDKGANCMGAIKMINFPPSPLGLWGCIMAGFWAPERDFSRHVPLLEQIGATFAINDQYARRYIQSGLQNLRRLQRQTAAAMQDLNRAREQNQADWEARQSRKDFMDSKWDDYRRGNSYWVSDLEGGKVYHTDPWGTRDTVTGDYYEGRGYNWTNFEGQNPRHPSEDMREVSSYELQQMTGRPR